MTTIRAQVILHTVDAFAANYVTNSWALESGTSTDPGTDFTPAFDAFYTAMQGYLSPTIATSGHQIKWYDLPGPGQPNYPFDETTFGLGAAPSGTALPDELAVCLSFQGVRVAGQPQARRRGRIYFGPVDQTAQTANRPSAGILTALATAAVTFQTDIQAAATGADWVIWSVANQSAVPVVDGWIDNAFDVQRRRGVEATSRTTWVSP